MKLEEIKKLSGIYVSSNHSSGFDYCELDWLQDVVWEEGELEDEFGSIEEFLQYHKHFYLTVKDAFNKINKIEYEY